MFIDKKLQVSSTINELSRYDFRLKWLEFSDEMDLTTRRGIFDNVKQRDTNCLKTEDLLKYYQEKSSSILANLQLQPSKKYFCRLMSFWCL